MNLNIYYKLLIFASSLRISHFDDVSNKTIKLKCAYCVSIRQYQYTAYRLVVCWACGILGRRIRKPLLYYHALSVIRRQFPSISLYQSYLTLRHIINKVSAFGPE